MPIPLILPTNEIRDLLILGLLHRGLIALITLTKPVLLDCVDTYVIVSNTFPRLRMPRNSCGKAGQRGGGNREPLTLVKKILVLLALPSTACS